MPNPVQHNTAVVSVATTTAAITATSTPAVGNSVYLVMTTNGPGSGNNVASVADNQSGNIWVKCAQNLAQSGFAGSADIWYCPTLVNSSGSYIVTATWGTSTGGISGILGFVETSPLVLDIASSVNDGGTAVSTLTATNATANASATDFVLATVFFDTNTAGASGLTTPPGNNGVGAAFSSLYFQDQTGGNIFDCTSAGYKTETTIVTESATWTETLTTARCVAALASFTSAGPPPPPLVPSRGPMPKCIYILP